MRFCILVVLLLGLGACSDREQPGLDALKQGVAGILGRGGKAPTAEEIRATATPTALAKIGRPVLLAQLPKLELADIVIFVQNNGPYSTWFSSDGVSFVFRNGVLTSTKGMGFDLMTADVATASQAIVRGSGQATRVHRYLGDNEQLVKREFTCTYGRTQKGAVSEKCKSEDDSFENLYWIRGGGIVKSRQWISPERGYLVSERLS